MACIALSSYVVSIQNASRLHFTDVHIDKVEVVEKQAKKIFTMSNVSFDFSKSTLSKQGENELLKIVAQLSKQNLKTLEVNGYTDNVGNEVYNMKLSTERAETVKMFLQRNGISIPIKTHGYGSQSPVMPNTSAANRDKNRRVEIILN